MPGLPQPFTSTPAGPSTTIVPPPPLPHLGGLGGGAEPSEDCLLLLKSGDVLSREEILHQWRYVAQALQDGVHVAGVAQVSQSCHALEV